MPTGGGEVFPRVGAGVASRAGERRGRGGGEARVEGTLPNLQAGCQIVAVQAYHPTSRDLRNVSFGAECTTSGKLQLKGVRVRQYAPSRIFWDALCVAKKTLRTRGDQESWGEVCSPRPIMKITAPMTRAAGPDEYFPPPVPATRDITAIRQAAVGCRACPLWRNATCTVFGEGPSRAKIMLVGEQPGDQEDRAGAPFVGPAGQLLNRALEAAKLDRGQFYVTNAVKHFKWTPQGKRRLHAKPNAREMAACRPWLEAEVKSLKPRLIVCLGATAAQQVIDKTVRVTQVRGQVLENDLGVPALVTVHPSSLLRRAGAGDMEQEFELFVRDLTQIRELAK